MFRPMPLLVGAALALVALGGYDVLRGAPEPVAPLPAAAAPAPIELTASLAPIGEVVTSSGATRTPRSRPSRTAPGSARRPGRRC
jgi:hypothetical protein